MPKTDQSPYLGYVDGLHEGTVAGWCMERGGSGAAVTVEIFEGAQRLGVAVADIFRSDLLQFGGDGHAGFSFPIPQSLMDGESHSLSVRVGPKGEFVLPGSPCEIRMLPLDESYEGEFEGVENGRAFGWARNWQRADEDPVIGLIVEGRLVASGKAYPKPGAAEAEERRFEIPLPELLLDGREHLLTAVIGMKQLELQGSPRRFRVELEVDAIDLAAAQQGLDLSRREIEDIQARLHEIAGFARKSAQLNQLAAEAVQSMRSVVVGFERQLIEIGSVIDGLAAAEIDVPAALLEKLEAVAERLASATEQVGLVNRLNLAAQQPVPLLEEITRRYAPIDFAAGGPPKVSIIIPVYNQFFYTYQCLASLKKSLPAAPIEIVLVDDCSTDETVVSSLIFPGIVVLRNATNSGFLDSCLKGAEAARGEYLMFLNNDTTVEPGAVDELLATLQQRGVGLAGAKLVFPDDRLQEAGGIIFRDGSASNYGRGDDPQRSEYSYLRSVDYCSGAAIMLPRAIWDQVGGFDTRFRPAYYEDADLCMQVRAAGYDVLYQPFAVVKHFEGISSGTDPNRGVKAYQTRNAKLFYDKWTSELTGRHAYGEGVLMERDRGVTRRALFVDACTPTPDQDAGSTVAMAHMRALQALGYKVTFVPENFAYLPDYTPALQRLGIEAIYTPSYTRLEGFLRDRAAEFDVVYLHRFSVAEKCLPSLHRYAPNATILFNPADLHFLRETRAAELAGAAAELERAAETKEREFAVIRAVDCTILHSAAEMDLVRAEMPEAFLHYLPWVIDTAPLPRPAFEAREGFMFMGGFRHPPNADAVEYFVHEVMPFVRRKLPGICFYIYGSHMPPSIEALEAPDIVVCGFAPDLTPVFDRHRVSVVPLRYGAGFKGKVAMSLAHGVPVVGSPIAIEGTGLRDGEHILEASDPGDFAAALAKLYTDRTAWEALSQAGRNFVAENFSAQRAREHFTAIFNGLGGTAAPVSEEQAAAPKTSRRSQSSGRSSRARGTSRQVAVPTAAIPTAQE